MTDLRQAAQQALHELEGIPFYRKYGVRISTAITALKAALEQQAEPVSGCACRWDHEDNRVVTCERHQGWLDVIAEWADRAREAEAKLKAAQPEQQAEPVAWMVYTQDGQSVYVTDNPADIQEGQRSLPLYTTPPQQQAEPVAWDKPSASFNEWWDSYRHNPANPFAEGSAAYWAWAGWQAAKRPWVGLTDEDFLEACQIAERGNYLVAFQRIQIKLKERNHD